MLYELTTPLNRAASRPGVKYLIHQYPILAPSDLGGKETIASLE